MSLASEEGEAAWAEALADGMIDADGNEKCVWCGEFKPPESFSDGLRCDDCGLEQEEVSYADLLLEVPVGETVYVKWHYTTGTFPPHEPSEFTGEIIEHQLHSTHIRNSFNQNLYLYRGDAILDVDWKS